MTHARLIVATVLLTLGASPARGQVALSAEAGFVAGFDYGSYLVGLRATGGWHGVVGTDFSLATLPQAVAVDQVLLLQNLDMALALPVGSRAWVVPRFGVSVVLDLASLDVAPEGAMGLNGGIGLLGRLSERTGLRLDLIRVHYLGGYLTDPRAGYTAVTVGLAWMP